MIGTEAVVTLHRAIYSEIGVRQPAFAHVAHNADHLPRHVFKLWHEAVADRDHRPQGTALLPILLGLRLVDDHHFGRVCDVAIVQKAPTQQWLRALLLLAPGDIPRLTEPPGQ